MKNVNSRPMNNAKPGPKSNGRFAGQKAKDFKGSLIKLLKYLKPFYLPFFASLLFTIGGSLIAIIAPNLIQDITNLIQVSQFGQQIDIAEISRLGCILVALYLSSALLNFLQGFLMSGVNQGVAKSLRNDISQKINKIPLSYFDSRSYGDVLSRVTNDVDTIGQSLNQSITSLISSSVLLVGVLIAMFMTSPKMALTAIATVPLSAIFMGLIVKVSQKYFLGQQTYLGELNGHIEETYSGQNVVKAFNAEDKVVAKFDKTNKKLFNTAYKSQFLSGLMMPIMTFVSNLGYVAICVVGGILFRANEIDIGAMYKFFIYLRLFQNSMSNFAQVMNMLQSTAAASERVFEFLGEKEQEDESYKTTTLKNIKGEVEFRNVQFGYTDDRTIIKDFSIKVKPGQKVAIVGPTGAGKTTLVNLLMRFYEPTKGEILIDGVPTNQLTRENVREFFSMVLQDTWLFEGTIKENIVYSKENVSDEDIVKACESSNIHHYIKTLPHGYDMVLDDDCNISSGQRQLMTIARAMVQNSPMLILDEATSSVDTRTEQLIQDAMDNLTKGRTSFVIAHRLSTIKNSDLILVMKDGDIVEKGNHEELLKNNGFYASLYNSQFENVE